MVWREKVCGILIVRIGLADLAGFGIDIACSTGRVGEAVALVHLRVDPDFSALPGAEAEIDRGIDGLPGRSSQGSGFAAP